VHPTATGAAKPRSLRPHLTAPDHPEAARGALAASACYLFWGLVPLYWKQLQHVDSWEIVAHRQVWSLVALLLILAATGGLGAVRALVADPRSAALTLAAALLLATNWLVYVIGVNSGRVTECSLGYYLVPLVNVLAGRFVLHETLRPVQWLAIGSAAVGVVVLVVDLGGAPWIALLLAGSWGAYSLLRKRSKVAGATALTAETLLLTPLALGWLGWLAVHDQGVLGRGSVGDHFLALSMGPVTALPLLLFAYGAQRIRLSTLGLLQYLSPSVQLLLGIVVYGEPFTTGRAVSFACIWTGLAVYTADNLLRRRGAGG
jgi:chloramphenicol-sensitive protein RarD